MSEVPGLPVRLFRGCGACGLAGRVRSRSSHEQSGNEWKGNSRTHTEFVDQIAARHTLTRPNPARGFARAIHRWKGCSKAYSTTFSSVGSPKAFSIKTAMDAAEV